MVRQPLLFILVALATACSGGTPSDPGDDSPGPLVSLVAVSGENQFAWPGRPVGEPLVVEARDQSGAPVPGAPVTWSVARGAGTVNPRTSVTDASGRASTTWTLGPVEFGQVAAARAGPGAVDFGANLGVSGEWEVGPQMRARVRSPAVATDGERVWLLGGQRSDLPINETQVFDTRSNSWSPGTPTPVAVDAAAAVYRDGFIHLLGGVDVHGTLLDTHWILDLATGLWSEAPRIPAAAAAAAAAWVNGRIVVAGGTTIAPGLAYTDDVFLYDPETRTWTASSPLPAPISGWESAVLNGEMFGVGGIGLERVASERVLRFNPGDGAWPEVASVPLPRFSSSVAAGLGLICVVAGVVPNAGVTTAFDCYSPSLRRWFFGPPLPVPIYEAGAAFAGGSLFIFGGEGLDRTATSRVYRFTP